MKCKLDYIWKGEKFLFFNGVIRLYIKDIIKKFRTIFDKYQ